MASEFDNLKGAPQQFISLQGFDVEGYTDELIKQTLNTFVKTGDNQTQNLSAKLKKKMQAAGHNEIWNKEEDGRLYTVNKNIDLESMQQEFQAAIALHNQANGTDVSPFKGNVTDAKYWKKRKNSEVTHFDLKTYKEDLLKTVKPEEIENILVTEPVNTSFRSDYQKETFKRNIEVESNVKFGESIDISTKEGRDRFQELKEQNPDKKLAYELMTEEQAKQKAVLYVADEDYRATSTLIEQRNEYIRNARGAQNSDKKVETVTSVGDTSEQEKVYDSPYSTPIADLREKKNGHENEINGNGNGELKNGTKINTKIVQASDIEGAREKGSEIVNGQ